MSFIRSDLSLPPRVPMERFFGALADILDRPGPFLTVFLPIRNDADVTASRVAVEDADLSDIERVFCESLLDGGTADAVAANAEATNTAGGEDAAAMVVGVMAGDGMGFSQTYPEGPASPLIERSHVPRLAPIIDAEQRLRHHLLVVVSDDSLDVMTFPRHGDPSMHRSEESDRNRQAHLVAEAVKLTETQFVLLAGSPDDVVELRDALLPSVPVETVVETISTPELDADAVDWLADRAVAEVATDRARATVDTLRTWKFERAHGLGLSDVVDVVRALRDGNTRLLLVADDIDDRRQVWVGPSGEQIAIDLEDVHDIEPDGGEFVPVRLVDGLVRSALLQGIPVQVVPTVPDSSLPGGVGAVIEPSNLDVV